MQLGRDDHLHAVEHRDERMHALLELAERPFEIVRDPRGLQAGDEKGSAFAHETSSIDATRTSRLEARAG